MTDNRLTQENNTIQFTAQGRLWSTENGILWTHQHENGDLYTIHMSGINWYLTGAFLGGVKEVGNSLTEASQRAANILDALSTDEAQEALSTDVGGQRWYTFDGRVWYHTRLGRVYRVVVVATGYGPARVRRWYLSGNDIKKTPLATNMIDAILLANQYIDHLH